MADISLFVVATQIFSVSSPALPGPWLPTSDPPSPNSCHPIMPHTLPPKTSKSTVKSGKSAMKNYLSTPKMQVLTILCQRLKSDTWRGNTSLLFVHF